MHSSAAPEASASHSAALLRGRFAGGHRRRAWLFGGHREIASVSCLGKAARHAGYQRPVRPPQIEGGQFMKPCLRNREQIALLALDALEFPNEEELRAHLESCAG